jgi:hypothetical protein
MLGVIIIEIWLCLLVAAVIGYAVGWLLRGMRADSSSTHAIDTALRQRTSNLTSANIASSNSSVAFELLRSDIANLAKRIAPYETVLLDRDARIGHLQQRVASLETRSVQEANVIAEVETPALSSSQRRTPRRMI